MKKIIIFICISFFCILSFKAQGKKGSREKIKALKVAYLTEQLNLTSSEAEKFWPIYNEFDKNNHSLRSKLRYEIKKAKKSKGDSITEKEAETLVKLKLSTDKEIYESQKEFIAKIKKVISFKKIIQLQVAEMEFGRKLMKRYKRKKVEKN